MSASAGQLVPQDLTTVDWIGGDLSMSLWCVADLDALLDRMLAERGHVDDDDIPYYAHLWPSARVLATELAKGPTLTGARVLEVGCGLGLVGLVAALKGADVTLSDLLEPAVALARRNAAHGGLADRVTVRCLDWREPVGEPAEILLASDVLYEARFAQPLAAALLRLLAPGGTAWLADPCRPHVERFVQLAEGQGLWVREGPTRRVEGGGGVRLFALQRKGEPVRPAPWEVAP